MKTRTQNKIRSGLGLLALGLCLLFASNLHAAFVQESATEFFSDGDFNGDGITDVLVLDKATGNARVGYSDGNGGLIWSAPLPTGIENVTGLGVQHFLTFTIDSIAVTAPAANGVNLLELSQTNTVGTTSSMSPVGIGPHAVAGLLSPLAPPVGGPAYMLIASSKNNAPAERLDFLQWFTGPNFLGFFSESNSFERVNELNLNTNTPTFAVGLARGATNDELHLWQFTNSPAVLLAFSNLPSGGDYVFGNFNGEAVPRFIFYQPGSSNLNIVPLLQTNGALAFGVPLAVPLDEAVQRVYTLGLGTNGAAIIQFGDGVQGLRLPGGAPVLSPKYQTGTGAAGNVFVGVVPLTNGLFALLDSPPGISSSTHAQVIQFDGTNFTQRSASNLPGVTSKSTRANVWLFQLEPFVNRSPGYLASLNSPDWTDAVGGLPGVIQVPTEADGGASTGLQINSTNNLGAAPSGVAFGLANQYNPAISVFTYAAPRAADAINTTISPPPGSYGSPLGISFTVTPAFASIRYRTSNADTWHIYAGQFFITNDATIDYYGVISTTHSSLQSATYKLGVPDGGPALPPVVIDPNNTNTNPIFSTNQLTLSANGTVFYGRRSASNAGTIWSINLDGSGDTYITTGVRPRVSHDGRWLAFLREGNPFNGQGNVWLRDLVFGTESRLFTNPDYITGYDWEANANALLIDNACGIYDLNTNGTLTSIINFNCLDEAPARNPVDGRIAFHNLSPTGPTVGIYVTAADGSARQRIVSNVPGASWPAWSPDGTDLVFADSNNTNANSGKNLWLVYPDGTGLLQISGFTDPTNGFPHGAIWSPDDETLVTAGTVFGTNGLWLIPLTPDHAECDGAPIRLSTSPGDAIDFAGSVVVASPPAVAMPGLFIRLEPNAAVVYWSTNYNGFVLEYNTDLKTNSWTTITGPYFLAGQYYEYHEARSALAAAKFFRLRYPGIIFLTPAQATLSFSLQSSQAVLNWPSAYVGYTLESTTNLNPPSLWTPVSGTYGSTNGQFEFRQNLGGGKQREFFRLRWP